MDVKVSVFLWSKEQACLLSDIIKITLTREKIDMLIPRYKRSRFPKLWIPLCNATHLDLFVILHETWDKWNWCKYVALLLNVPWATKFFVFGPGVSCLPPASMKCVRLTCELSSRVKSHLKLFTVLDSIRDKDEMFTETWAFGTGRMRA